MLRHQASTWELVHVLFRAIEGEAAAGADAAAAEMGEDDVRLDRLAAFKRRAGMRCAPGRRRGLVACMARLCLCSWGRVHPC